MIHPHYYKWIIVAQCPHQLTNLYCNSYIIGHQVIHHLPAIATRNNISYAKCSCIFTFHIIMVIIITFEIWIRVNSYVCMFIIILWDKLIVSFQRSSVASFLVLGGGGGGDKTQMYRQEKKVHEIARASASKHIYFQVSQYICVHVIYNQCSSLFILLVVWRYKRTTSSNKTLILRKSMYIFFMRAYSKTVISFNILLVLPAETLSQPQEHNIFRSQNIFA